MNNILQRFLPHEVAEITDYKIENLAVMFFIFAFIGFVWEVIYTAVTEKVVAKRGMLHGPWVPLYGVGGVLILSLLGRYESNPPLVFILAASLCTVIEYSTGVIVERFYGQRWWDYSSKRVNFKGRVCLSGMLLFGAAGTLAVCGFGPALNNNISNMNFPIHAGLVAILMLVFAIDVFISAKRPNRGNGVTYELKQQNNPDETPSDENTAE